MVVSVSKKAKKQFDKIPDRVFEHILGKILDLARRSANLNTRKLTNRVGFRLRVGDYRVIYTTSAGEIVILSVAHRKDAYRK